MNKKAVSEWHLKILDYNELGANYKEYCIICYSSKQVVSYTYVYKFDSVVWNNGKSWKIFLKVGTCLELLFLLAIPL